MNQLCSKPKGDPRYMEDYWVCTSKYAAVFDGATPKTAFLFPGDVTPGQMAARTLAHTLDALPPDLTARQAVDRLTAQLATALQGHRAEASGVIYSVARREVWSVGDCQFAFISSDDSLTIYHNEKLIDRILSQWRSSIIQSYLTRGLLTPGQILADDPGRRIIQPYITRQTRYQNIPSNSNPLAFGVFDGTHIPNEYISVTPVPEQVTEIILASDGYPQLCRTVQESEAVLQRLLLEDPLCIGPLCGTKGIRPGATCHDDRTYLKIDVPSSRTDGRSKRNSTHPQQP